MNLGLALRNYRFRSSERTLYPILSNLLKTGNFTRPMNVAQGILSLLKHDPLIEDLLTEKNTVRDLNEVTIAIENLNKIPPLYVLMRICPLNDLQLEGLFVSIRKTILIHLDEIELSPVFVSFLSTLTLHCFTNEYVYFESDEEIQLVNKLGAEIAQAILLEEQPRLIDVMCLAIYRPLYRYDWCEKLEVLDQLPEVKSRLIDQPLFERVIAKDMRVLKSISDETSEKVRAQYEENPYPRWIKLCIHIKNKSIAENCDEIDLQLHSENIRDVSSPAILVAGCGTGQHSIETASSFSDCQVTAVDLSLSSLAYAQRKTNELGISNVDYMHADILDLGHLDRAFDIIESAGVLHHMDDPMGGWKVLVDLLKPGGLMKIGLYSELARGSIAHAREEIGSLGVGTSEAEIRKYRQSLVESHNEQHKQLTQFRDFFSLSTLRDLIFHVQEHRFTLPQIQDCLDELGLNFCGFESKDIVSQFRKFHGDGSDIYDLALWHQLEENSPHTFAGMYQFWCQKS